MKTFVEIDDERFIRLCQSVEDIHAEAMSQTAWAAINALGITPYKDGNQWCFLYGEDLQEGIAGFGNTIFDAAWDFYSNLINNSLA